MSNVNNIENNLDNNKKINEIHTNQEIIINQPEQPNQQLESVNNDFVFNNWMLIRGSLLFAFITIIALNSIFGMFLSHGDVPCIYDMSFDKTKGLNQFFANNIKFKNALLIISSLCLDINLLIMSAYWTVKGKSWRIILTLFLFYLTRGICQVILIF
jgi:hypothetical protein